MIFSATKIRNNVKTKRTIVVIGNGMVGYKFCEKLIEKGGNEDFHLVTFCEEPYPAYDRVKLTSYFAGVSKDDLTLAHIDWYHENEIELHVGDKVVSINRRQKTVRSAKGLSIAYDKLIFATGSYPMVPPIQGIEKKGVFVYRTFDDLDTIMAYAKNARCAAVIGGGLLGLEAAKAVVDLGLETHIVEFAPRLMPRQIDSTGSAILVNKIGELGAKVHLDKETTLIKGNGCVQEMHFKDGTVLGVDMIVVSAGIKPRDELAREAGLAVGERGGIIVDDGLQTSDPDIFAIGEVALHKGFIYGLVAPGYEMAEVVAANFLDDKKTFLIGDVSTKLKLMGVDVATFGDAFGETPHCQTLQYQNDLVGVYKRLTVSEDGKTLLGGMLVGDAAAYGQLLQVMKNATILPDAPEDLLLPARSGSGNGLNLSIADLPDDAQICSCNNVVKGKIVQAIKDGTHELAGLKRCTKAGTGCGGCVPQVADILKSVLKTEGMEVNNNLCEHFQFSRQELFQIVKVKKLKTFNELLTSHGQGNGCEICKPAVASILASLWNDMIMKHETIQDTNDRFLANIQRGGTYSVIPRIPGGEITPDKLIALGTVANKYGLYCKITGAQRIDLLGAQVEQLPAIWEELIAAGFESGHAYGKAMRTVKSCIGSTWCRYGVQDSTGFAIRIEDRYKGIRAPHKLKAACSGCIRECAEAQSKDFGVVATEKGWNLYVGGNGGAKPQHGILFASDLDEDTCIKYIDRFLMYYIHTADKLTRTAPWFNQLDGGIEHLRKVIIEDSLGICNDLDADMQRLVATYACEWNVVVKDREKRKRFRHFINSQEPDENLKWIFERDQKRPANWIKKSNGNSSQQEELTPS